MLVIFCFQFSGSITSYAYRHHFNETLHQNMETTFGQYNGQFESEVTQNARRGWDRLQADVRSGVMQPAA
jgi:hypothetical protein